MTCGNSLAAGGWPDDQVRELIARAQAGDGAAREALVEGNLRLVRSVVQRFAPGAQAQETDDLFQVGCIGLLKAIDRFDLSLGLRFSTYAVPLILGEVRRYLRDDGPVHVSRSMKQLAALARRTEASLAASLGRDPTAAEVASALGEAPEDVVTALESARQPASFHQTVHEGDGEPLYLIDQLAAEGESEGGVIDTMLLREALGRLPGRERLVILLRYLRGRTQGEVARVLGVSQVQVSRLERRALAALRQFAAG